MLEDTKDKKTKPNIVNNADWLQIKLYTFLRDIGSRTINKMLTF